MKFRPPFSDLIGSQGLALKSTDEETHYFQPKRYFRFFFGVSLYVVLSLFFHSPILVFSEMGGADIDSKFNFSQWPYPKYKEVVSQLQKFSKRYPKLTHIHSIGKSGEGRDLIVIEISNTETGPGEAKPAIWIQAGIHANEVSGRQIVMYFVQRLLESYGRDSEATRLLDTRTFYIMPIFDVDGGEKVLTRHPAWPGHKPEEHKGKDLDGDGFITTMRVKDTTGKWYPSSLDSRVMLRARSRNGGRWNYVPTDWNGQFFREEDPEPVEDELAPRDQRYHLYTEGETGPGLRQALEGRESANFNRNWSAEWRAEQWGAGPYPFSLPEVNAVAHFISSHKNIFFCYDFHSNGSSRNILVRPPMDHPYEFMPPEDNDFYFRLSGVWSAISGGDIMINTWYSQELMAGYYHWDEKGFFPDWAYMHQGIHAISPETDTYGKDYDGDGYITIYETLRWNDEELEGKYFAPWKPYKHPVFGDVEVGGWRSKPSFGDRLKKECHVHYKFLLHVSGLSPLLRIKNLTAEPVADGKYQIVADVQNQGWLATYVTRNAQKIRRDYPIVTRIHVTGGKVVDDNPLKNIGHILGRLSYVRTWGDGLDASIKTVEWAIEASEDVPCSVTVEAWAHKAGKDKRTITLSK